VRGALAPISKALKVLPNSAQRKLWFYSLIQVCLNTLDLVGVALLGVIGALSVAGVSSRTSPGLEQMLQKLQLANFSFVQQVVILGVISSTLFVLKAIISIRILRRINVFLSNQAGILAEKVIGNLLHQPLTFLNSNSVQKNLYTSTIGIEKLLVGILGAFLGVIADGFLLILLLITIAIVDPLLALVTLIFFGSVIFYLYLTLNKKARLLGNRQATLSIDNNQLIVKAFSTYRETLVGSRTRFYADLIGKQTKQVSFNASELTSMPNISKYVLETSIVVGSLIISAIQFSLYDSIKAVGILSIYLAASSRIVPAMLRLQQGFLSVQSSAALAESTFILLEKLIKTDNLGKIQKDSVSDFVPSIKINKVSMQYGTDMPFVLKDINLEIKPGEFIGIVGESGTGKSTLVDLILGVEEPKTGNIKISGVSPREAFQMWPGQVGYVPQDVFIFEGTLAENVLLGYDKSDFSDEDVLQALTAAHLSIPGVNEQELLSTLVSDRGSNLSGGQRQRIGIARALLMNPKLLVLDESTSALDPRTEEEIVRTLLDIKGKCTILFISHKRSLFAKASRTIELIDGNIFNS
jgi:ABC-type bacteriocin/lantibiotic exporter with double-glycine peptidase domain